MKKAILIFVIIIFAVHLINAQSKILYHKTSTEKFEVKFNPAYPTSTLPNYFVDEIAKAIPKIRMYTKINYQYSLETKVIKKGNKYHLFLKIKDITHGGNFKYKDFDFSHLVAPNQIEQSLKIDDISSHKTYFIKIRIGFHKQDSIWAPIKSLNGVITSRVSARPEKVRFVYDEDQKTRFQKAIEDIDNYYDDDLKLDALKKRFLALNFDKVDVVAIRNVDLKYIEKDLNKIQPKRYSESLNLDSYDPIRLLAKYNSLQNMIQRRREIMNQKMGSLDQVYYAQALEELEIGNEIAAQDFFQKSIKVNPYYSPSVYHLSLIDYQHKKYTDCFDNIKHILNDLKPDQNTKKQSINLANLAYDSLMQICHNLNKEEKYNQSIGLLYQAKSFCDSTKYFSCDNRLEQYISQAIYGLYSSYLSIARASLQKGRLDMCQDYMKMAMNFKTANKSKLIGKDAESKKIMVDLIGGLVQQSEQANTAGDLPKAKDLLNQAKKLCNENPDNGCKTLINKKQAIVIQEEYEGLIQQSLSYSKQHKANQSKEYLSLAKTYQQLHSDFIPTSLGTDTIDGKVRFLMYQENIANGKADLQQENFAYALTEFLEAKKLEDTYVFEKNHFLPIYIKEAAQPMILDILKQGNLKAWGKRYNEAALLLDSAVNMSEKYGLSDSLRVISATKDLQNQLKKNVCDQLNSEYNKLIQKANASIRFDDFYNAILYWKKASFIASNNLNCHIENKALLAKLKKYQYDMAYKVELHKADSLMDINVQEAFSHLKNAEECRLEYSSKMHMKTIPSLLNNILVYKKPELNTLGIRYFNANNEMESSFKLMQTSLINHELIDKKLITQTAHLLAIFDMDKSNSNSIMAEKRFGNKKELQTFKKAYIRASKK